MRSKIFIGMIAALVWNLGPAKSAELAGKKSTAEILEATVASDWREIPAEELLVIELERGRVVVALSPVLAKAHVKQIKTLAREKFYDGLSFYRVIDGFVAQGGDPFGERAIKDARKIMDAEFDEKVGGDFSDIFTPLPDRDGYASKVGFVGTLPVGYDRSAKRAWHLHCAGALAFGRENEKNTASTEIYITLQPQRYLDRNLSVVGRVIDGMEHIQSLRRVMPPETKDDDLGEQIISVRVASDLPEHTRPTFEILNSGMSAFDAYLEARRNRPEAFFWFRPDYLDICQLPIPVRAIEAVSGDEAVSESQDQGPSPQQEDASR